MAEFKKGRIGNLESKKFKLDIKDRKILKLLSEDGRIPISKIAKKVRLSRDGISYRIKRLVKNEIILGFIPKINLREFGYESYHVFMILDTFNSKKKKEFIRELKAHPNTVSIMEYHDTWDLELVITARNVREFDDIITDVTKNYSNIILRKDKLTLIKGYKSIQLPDSLYIERKEKKTDKSLIQKKYALDKKDIEILRLLSKDSRRSTYELSKAINLSPDTISHRIKKMIKSKIIFGFTVLINLRAISYKWYTFCINVKNLDLVSEMKFKEFIKENPYIIRAVKVFGDWDLLLYITSDTTTSFHKTFKKIQANLQDILLDSQIWIAYQEHVYNSFPKAIIDTFGN